MIRSILLALHLLAKRFYLIGALCVMLSLHATAVLAGDVTLAWDANQESNVGGYRIYYGLAQRSYSSPPDEVVGRQTTQYTVSGTKLAALAACGTYYFAVKAYDTARTIESGYSNEVSATIACAPLLRSIAVTPASPTILTGTTQQFTATGTYSDNSTQNLTSQVTWTSSATAVATINSAGLATGVSAGSTTISATLSGVTGSTTLTVQTVPAGSLPSPWQARDIGSVGRAGSASYTNGIFTVSGSGADIWDTTDAFHFVYQPLTGDGAIVARVASITNTWPWAKAGVMIRESLATNARHAMVVVTPGNGVAFQRRTTTGGSSYHTAGAGAQAPYWVKLERAGNTFTAYQSANGSNWTQIGSATITMTASVYIGLAVTSTNNSALNTAILDNVVVNTGSATAVAQSSATLTSGAAPLAENFTDTASAIQTDTTSAGGDALEPALVEAGEIEVDQEWQRVAFTHAFVDPVVVAKPLSNLDPELAVVRIDNVDATGFDIRLQEWDYLDGLHALERVGYLVMERGSHVLTDGTRVEADQFQSNDTRCCATVMFGQAFQTTPVVLATVTSVIESDAVVSRLRHISTTDFQFQMQEQEANTQIHATETVSYIAWEPSSGTVDGLAFTVNRTDNGVTHQPYRIDFPTTLVDIPVFLADLQTANGPDTANLRWDYKDLSGVDVHVTEEQSGDSETSHNAEAVGYFLFSPVD